MKKLFVVGTQDWYADWVENTTRVQNIEEADIVFFTGGEDINPEIYNCAADPSTYFSRRRDAKELAAWHAMTPNQRAFGTCRGLQLLCALNGGLLIQDVDNHGIWGTHGITNGEEEYEITSLHHQMAYPWTINPDYYKILYWSSHQRSTHYSGDKIERDKIICEPEIIQFNVPGNPVCLGVQGHPEMMDPNCATVRMINDLVKDLF